MSNDLRRLVNVSGWRSLPGLHDFKHPKVIVRAIDTTGLTDCEIVARGIVDGQGYALLNADQTAELRRLSKRTFSRVLRAILEISRVN